MNTSNPSLPVFSIHIPPVSEIKANFIYNFYVRDESVNPETSVPDEYSRLEKTESALAASRIPRYIKLNWSVPTAATSGPTARAINNEKIELSLEKIVSEERFMDGIFIPYVFSGDDSIEKAYRDINNDGVLDIGTSQATNIDNYVQNLMESFNPNGDLEQAQAYSQKISDAIKSIEKISDNPMQSLGLVFLDEDGNKIDNPSGFDQIVSKAESLAIQINSSVLPDIFVSASLPAGVVNEYNAKNNGFREKRMLFDPSELAIEPITVYPTEVPDPESIETKVEMIGYVVEKYEKTTNGSFVKLETYSFDDTQTLGFNDFRVKYGSTYFYSIRSIAAITTVALDNSTITPVAKKIKYLVGSRPKVTQVTCTELIPPPAPAEIYFNWNYYEKKLRISWAMPSNPQRDIKQFQVFRRSSIKEPFELIAQKCFDNSSVKYLSGEVIDGNKEDMNEFQKSFVEYSQGIVAYHDDLDFKTDIEYLESSKYIYAIASVDAHGLASGYSKQYEISFDFFKNSLTRRVISSMEAPRPYPNLYLETDLFRDTIKVKGESSTMMKVYFVPEYFKVSYTDGRIQKMVATKQESSFYKLQFINTQNQKTDSLKITVDDPNGLTSV